MVMLMLMLIGVMIQLMRTDVVVMLVQKERLNDCTAIRKVTIFI